MDKRSAARASVGALTKRCFMRDSSPSVTSGYLLNRYRRRRGRAPSADKLKRFIVQATSLLLFIRPDLLMSIRPVCDRAFKQRAVVEGVCNFSFESGEVRIGRA